MPVTVQELAEQFDPDPAAVSRARHFLRSALSDLAVDEAGQELADSLLLAGNELATNAVLHARTEFTVRVLHLDDAVRVEVSDENTRMPQACLAPADATSGRGLAIVDGSGLAWGAERHAGGKTLWVQAPR